MQDYKILFTRLGMAFLIFGFVSCKKEKLYVYDVNPISVTQPNSNKINIKTDQEFISIAYTDLFGTTIAQDVLADLTLCYRAFGDKNVIIDMGIRNFLNAPNVQIPPKTEMVSDPDVFVENTYKKFYVREPNEFERWYMVNQIQTDTALTPELLYYSFLTSNEYRYY